MFHQNNVIENFKNLTPIAEQGLAFAQRIYRSFTALSQFQLLSVPYFDINEYY